MSTEAFARVPLWILGRSDLSWPAKILYGLLARYVGQQGSAWPSIDTIAGDMRTSRRNVERWLSELRSAGLVDVQRTGRANTYRILGAEPDEAPEDAILRPPPEPPPPKRCAKSGASDTPKVADQTRQKWRIRYAKTGASDTPKVAHQIRQDWRIRRADTSLREEIIEEREVGGSEIGRRMRARERLVDGLIARLQRGWSERYLRHAASPAPPDQLGRLRPLGTWCAEYLDQHPGDPGELVDTMLDAFFSRPKLGLRPRVDWLLENPARYIEAAAEAAAEADRKARLAALERAERERERKLELEAVGPPPDALPGLVALARGRTGPRAAGPSPEELRRERHRLLEEQRRRIEQAEVG